MRQLRSATLVPPGFIVDQASRDSAELRITVRHQAGWGLCPGCGTQSGRVHSRYQRRLTDLPMAGRPVRLLLLARRFRCGTVCCGRRIFTERFDDRRSGAVGATNHPARAVVHHLGDCARWPAGGSLGPATDAAGEQRYPFAGRASARQPAPVPADGDRHRRLGMAAQSALRDNHLRPGAATDRSPCCPTESRRRRRLGSRGSRRSPSSARDRGGGYALAAAKALPHATQVADRWHLDGECQPRLPRCGAQVDAPDPRRGRCATINPDLLTAAERIQYEGYLRREETNAAILALAEDGRRRSRRSYAVPDTAAVSSARSCAVSDATFSGCGRARSSITCPGSTRSGRLAVATVPNCGVGSRRRAFAARCGWSPNGRHAAGAPKGPTAQRLRRAPSARNDRPPDDRSAAMRCPSPRPSPSRRSRKACRSWSRPASVIAAFQAMIRKKSARQILTHGWNEPQASLVASFANGVTKDRPPWPRRSACLGPTARPKARSPSSSWSSARCTAAQRSTCFRQGSSAPCNRHHQNCARAKIGRRAALKSK